MAVRMTGLVSGMDTESIVKELMATQESKKKKITDKQTTLTWKEEKWKELNTKLYKLYTDNVSKMRLQGSYQTKKATASDDSKAVITAGTSAPVGAHTLEVKELASSQYVTGKKLDTTITSSSTFSQLGFDNTDEIVITVGNNESVKLSVNSNTTVSQFLKSCKDAGLNASYDTTQKRFFISSTTSGTDGAFTISSKNGALESLGLGQIDGTATAPVTGEDGMTVVKASNATIILDGAKLTSSNNTITANGLTINLKGVTSEVINLNVSNDTEATYNMIKGFVKEYNTILKSMNELYYADSAYGYDPLSDDEKEAMSEEEVEKWETKIKDSLLRRDSTLGQLMNAMKNSMMSSVSVGGKSYSLSTFGITTSSDYSEKGLLHIAGDEDDSIYAAEADKLKKALEEDPDTVMDALSQIGKKLYDTMSEKMKSISNVRSALTFYNDKEIQKKQTQYKKELATLEDKLTEMETRYYKQFSAMETALSKLESQSNALSGLLGLNS